MYIIQARKAGVDLVPDFLEAVKGPRGDKPDEIQAGMLLPNSQVKVDRPKIAQVRQSFARRCATILGCCVF